LSNKALVTTGKSVLFIVGAGFGLFRSLLALGSNARNSASLQALEARVDTVHLAISRLIDLTDRLQVGLDQSVTKTEMAETMDRVFGRMERSVEARFEHQLRSVESLRTMVGQTDEMLQRVLDRLEALNTAHDAGNDEESSAWNFTEATQ
jgi:hypothetical protein